MLPSSALDGPQGLIPHRDCSAHGVDAPCPLWSQHARLLGAGAIPAEWSWTRLLPGHPQRESHCDVEAQGPWATWAPQQCTLASDAKFMLCLPLEEPETMRVGVLPRFCHTQEGVLTAKLHPKLRATSQASGFAAYVSLACSGSLSVLLLSAWIQGWPQHPSGWAVSKIK